MAEARDSILYQPRQMTATDWLVDIVICLGAFGFGMMQLFLSASLFVPDTFTRMILGIQSVTPTIYAFAATLVSCAPLVIRRRYPWPVFIAALVLWVFFDWGFGITSLSMVGVLVALFTLAYERGHGEAFVAGIITLAVMVFSALFGSSSSLAALLVFQNMTLAIAVTLAGYALNARQEVAAQAEARAQEAERTRESEASRRVEEERVRIAREVHDITAHSLSAVSIQAAAAQRLVDVDPEAAKDAIAQVRSTAKSSLEDLRAMVGVLRAGTGEDADNGAPSAQTAPVEGTDRMSDLVDYLQDAGVHCDLMMGSYTRKSVPAHIDIALFGIAREACTNIVRHAQAHHARILLACENEAAVLEVTDDGNGINLAAASDGHGIEGMRERASLLGGTVSIENADSAGTVVRVRIPLAS